MPETACHSANTGEMNKLHDAEAARVRLHAARRPCKRQDRGAAPRARRTGMLDDHLQHAVRLPGQASARPSRLEARDKDKNVYPREEHDAGKALLQEIRGLGSVRVRQPHQRPHRRISPMASTYTVKFLGNVRGRPPGAATSTCRRGEPEAGRHRPDAGRSIRCGLAATWARARSARAVSMDLEAYDHGRRLLGVRLSA